MTQNEIREELHKRIDQMDAAKLRQLCRWVAELMEKPSVPEKELGQIQRTVYNQRGF